MLLIKSHVKAYTRHTKTGAAVQVGDYDNKVQKKPEDSPRARLRRQAQEIRTIRGRHVVAVVKHPGEGRTVVRRKRSSSAGSPIPRVEMENVKTLMHGDEDGIKRIPTQGCNLSYFIALKGDGEGVFKPTLGEDGGLGNGSIPDHSYWRREAAAYLLDRLLGYGVVPPTVIRQVHGVHGSMQARIDDTRKYGEAYNIDDETSGKTQLLDVVMNNTDRHRSNALVGKEDGRVHAIDNGLAFSNLFEGLRQEFDEEAEIRPEWVEPLKKLTLPRLRSALKTVGLEDWTIEQTYVRAKAVARWVEQEAKKRRNQWITTTRDLVDAALRGSLLDWEQLTKELGIDMSAWPKSHWEVREQDTFKANPDEEANLDRYFIGKPAEDEESSDHEESPKTTPEPSEDSDHRTPEPSEDQRLMAAESAEKKRLRLALHTSVHGSSVKQGTTEFAPMEDPQVVALWKRRLFRVLRDHARGAFREGLAPGDTTPGGTGRGRKWRNILINTWKQFKVLKTVEEIKAIMERRGSAMKELGLKFPEIPESPEVRVKRQRKERAAKKKPSLNTFERNQKIREIEGVGR